jgi:chromo domain-containing protein 1
LHNTKDFYNAFDFGMGICFQPMLAVKAIEKTADELVRISAGLFSSFPDFLVLNFPAKKDEWKFLESTLDYTQDARLRYFIFQSDVTT